MYQQKQRVLVIGAGPSGLSLLRAFQCEHQQWHDRIQLVCVQKQAEWGGQWNYIAKEKLDKNGLPIPSTNDYLWTNAPKQCFQYPDYSFEEHFNGDSMPSYLPRQFLRQYFIQRFSSYNLSKYIRYNTICYNIQYLESQKNFIVEMENLVTKQKSIERFDFVIVASGHYSMPNVPHVPGLKEFQGKLLHSIEVKDYMDYKNQRVLVIGSGLSAEDAILQCYKYGAESVTVTYRTRPMSQKFPSTIEQLPLLKKVNGNKVEFKNGQIKQFDTIIMCTGYVHNFTFLEESLRLKNSSKLWSDELFMGVVYIDNPQLMYVGTQAQYFSFMMFDIQSRFVKNIILGPYKLPSISQMKQKTIQKSQQLQHLTSPYQTIDFMGNYMKQLIDISEYSGYNIDKVIELYYELQQHKEDNILTFRDNIYQSAVSGKWSVMKKQTWLEAGASFEEGTQEDNEKIQELEINDYQRRGELQIYGEN